MFNNSKYGNLLTVILIVSIVAIVGIIGIIIYKLYNAYYIETSAEKAATQFENIVQNQITTENTITDNNNIQNEEKTDINGIQGTTSSGGNSTSQESGNKQSTTQYKGFDVVGTIQIPAIDLKYPILEKLSPKSLETSVVLLYTAQGLNNEGNSVIIGHNYRNGTMFSNVKKLDNGDYIYIIDETGRKVRYVIYNIYRASGTESGYMTRNTNGAREISLSTCTDDSKARTIVLAKEG